LFITIIFCYLIEKKKVNAPVKPAPPSVQQPNASPAMSTMMNGIKPPTPSSVTQTLPTATAPVSTPKSKQIKSLD